VKDTRADDFEGTAKALLKAYETADTLRAAVSCANGVHGWRGRMAYELLASADYLVQAAVQLLIHGSPYYTVRSCNPGCGGSPGHCTKGYAKATHLPCSTSTRLTSPTNMIVAETVKAPLSPHSPSYIVLRPYPPPQKPVMNF
jgi:hypothetical protein